MAKGLIYLAFDGLITGAMAISLNRLLAGGRIDKIYQPDSDELIFHIHGGKEKRRLYISSNSAHARIHLLSDDKEQPNPQNPSAFCMLLRKHFQGGRIKDIHQVQSERIIEIDIDQTDELGFIVNKRLTVEIMGKHSNIIAIDSASGRIIDSIKRISSELNRFRQILPGFPYVYPPDHGKVSFYEVSGEDLSEITNRADSPLPKALMEKIQGVNPAVAELICNMAINAAAARNADSLGEGDIHKIIQGMADSIRSGSYLPFVYMDRDNTPMDFHIFPFPDMENLADKITFENLSSAVEFYFSHKFSSNRIRQKSTDLTRALSASLDKLYLKKQKLAEELHNAENSELLRIYGELLTANLHNISPGLSSAKVLNYYNGEEIEIPLEPRYSPSVNAQRYFKNYGKAKTALREKKTQIEEADNSIGYLESVLVYVENADNIDEIEEIRHELAEGGYLRKRKNAYRASKSKLQPLAFNASDGSRIYVGRNNKENDHLSFRLAGRNDYWFHAKDIPGSHVILSCEKGNPSEQAMAEAASLAAYYSKARNSSKVPVDCTRVRHVRKTPGSKPGMVIYKEQRTIFVDPVRSRF
ncbi:NFACT RNA binding domain-containing protein [Bacillota bacterium]